jgi:Na+-transporting NADH:ubiquinone oxidoreductase subunit NqrF
LTHGRTKNSPFEILLAWSERSLTVTPGQTGLQVLVDAGIPIEPGCQVGGCGICAMPYIEGDIVHHDGCLDDAERERVFGPCVSCAKSRIVLTL